MKKFNRNTSIILIVLFILVTSYAAIDLLSLPIDILDSIGVSENTKVKKAQDVAFGSYIVLVLDFFIVLLLIFMFSMNNVNYMAENIVYVESEKKSEENELEEVQFGFDLEAAIHRVSTLANNNFENTKDKHTKLLNAICHEVEAVTAALYETDDEVDGKRFQKFNVGFAFYMPDSESLRYEFGEGLVGQAAKSSREIIINGEIPEGYIKVLSGLGESTPNNLIVLPIKEEESVKGILELAGFKKFEQKEIDFLRRASTYFTEDEENVVSDQVEEQIS